MSTALPASEKDHRRATAYAAKWHAEHERAEPPCHAEPTDQALAECFAGCVRPAKAEIYPLIRLYISAYHGDTTALAAAVEAHPRFRADDGRLSGRLFDDCAAEYGRDVTGRAWMQACLKASQDPDAAGTCGECGGPVERVDTPLPAAWAPVPWWHHASEAEARACPGRGPVLPAPVTVRAGDLVPGDTYASEAGTPVLDDLASHGGVPVGAIPRPFVAAVPLTVASVTPAAPLGGERAVYVEASNGHGSTVPTSMRTRIVQRGTERAR